MGSGSYFGHRAFLQNIHENKESGDEVCVACRVFLNAVVRFFLGVVLCFHESQLLSYKAAYPAVTLRFFLNNHGCLFCLMPKGADLIVEPE